MVNLKFFYRQIVSQDISLGAHDYYTISFFMDVIAFIIIAVGFSSFGVCLSLYVVVLRMCVSCKTFL